MNTNTTVKSHREYLQNKISKIDVEITGPPENLIKAKPNINCDICKGTGKEPKKESYKSISCVKEVEYTIECECITSTINEYKTTNDALQRLKELSNEYYQLFGVLDEELNLIKYKMMFPANAKSIDLLERYLKEERSDSVLLTGTTGVGKTTILKMIWQLLNLNKIDVYYFNCPEFEKLYHKEYKVDGASLQIEEIINRSKKAKYILMDDHIFASHKNMLGGYYEIFDNARAFKQKIIMASNLNFEQIIEAYSIKDSVMASRLQTRLENINILECEIVKSE